jgi:spore coat polysaccharide biosynthesis predicted glycosyltransferase SpsG
MRDIKLAFFTEAGTKRGLGHLIRSYTIYKKFKNLKINSHFFLDSDIDFKSKFSDIEYFKWHNFSLEEKYDIIFIDSYEADITIYEQISNASKVAVFIDDFKRLSYPKGVILNFAPDANELFFKQKDKKHIYLIGIDYIPIRDEFFKITPNKQKQIFIMLGGSDIADLSYSIVKHLKDIDIKKVIVSNKKDTVDKLSKYNNTEVLYKPTDKELISKMADSAVAISTASMSLYELAYLQIPTIIIAVDKNQTIGVSQLIKHNIASSFVSINNENWLNKIKYYVEKTYLDNIHSINQTIDGKGADRVLNKTMELLIR